ncbi:MAG: hypothetical protein AB8C02_03485 [Halioglobus sp.]
MAQQSGRVYPIDTWRLAVLTLPALLLTMLPAIVWLAIDTEPLGPSVVVAALVLPFVGLLVVFARRTRLELSDQGLRLRNAGQSMDIAWPNVKRFDLHHGAAVLNAPSDSPSIVRLKTLRPRSYSGQPFYGPEQQRLIDAGRYIDLQAFSQRLRGHDFQEQLWQLAPLVAAATELAATD